MRHRQSCERCATGLLLARLLFGITFNSFYSDGLARDVPRDCRSQGCLCKDTFKWFTSDIFARDSPHDCSSKGGFCWTTFNCFFVFNRLARHAPRDCSSQCCLFLWATLNQFHSNWFARDASCDCSSQGRLCTNTFNSFASNSLARGLH